MLYANTDDGSSALWVLDGDGVVVDNISYSIADRAPILAQINEHYGTSFTGWSDNEIGLSYGSTLPNWNAYEKIGLPKTYIAVSVGGGETPCAFGEVGQNNEVIFQSKDENTPWVASRAGVIVGEATGWPGIFTYVWKPKIDAALGIDSTASLVISSLEQGDEVPNWDSYQIIV